MNRHRDGFTVVELLVVAVLGTMILLSVYQVLVTNQRTYRENARQVSSQQTTRMAMDIVAAELKEVSPAGGDLIAISGSSVDYWAMTRFGLVCGIDYGPPVVLTVRKVEKFFGGLDRIKVFADNDTRLTGDDAWITANVTAIDSAGVSCSSGGAAQRLAFSGQEALFTADSVRTGAPIRALEAARLASGDFDGEPYLLLTRSGVTSPIAGPLDDDGLAFSFHDEDGSPTTVPADVDRIEIAIDAGSPLVTTVDPRN